MQRADIMTKFGGLLYDAAAGNLDAVEFMVDSFLVVHLWDDLIDNDRKIPSGEINGGFYLALVKIPQNTFYRANQERLAQFIERSVIDWLTATAWEERGQLTRQQAEIAYITRSSYTQIIIEVALLCGGFQHALALQETVRLKMHDEGVNGYQDSLIREV